MIREARVKCIVCPIGCEITVTLRNGEILSIKGNRCVRGAEYARQEVLEPKRMLITVIKVRGGNLPVVSVKTLKPIPKKLISKAIEALANLEVEAPIKVGDTVMKNLLDLGVDVVATRSVTRLRREESLQ